MILFPRLKIFLVLWHSVHLISLVVGGVQRGPSVHCGTQLTSLHGRIHSPNFPEPYPNNLQCEWNITVPQGFRIVLRFAQFDIESSLDCAYDYVIVHGKNNTVGRFCGQFNSSSKGVIHSQKSLGIDIPQQTITSESNILRIILHTDYSNEESYHGLEAHYAAEDLNECEYNNGDCMHICHNFIGGHVCSCQLGYILSDDNNTCIVQCSNVFYTAETGMVTSPEFPSNYPPLAYCDWTITAEVGYMIYLTFDKFAIEDHPDYTCPYDYLRLEDTSNLLGPLCGNKSPKTWHSSSNWLRITFRSDKSVSQSGFKVTYQTKGVPCPHLHTPVNGHIQSNNSNTTFRYKDVARYSCQKGYRLVGPETRTCTELRVWTGQEPNCEVVTCPNVYPPMHGRMEINALHYGNTANFSCGPFFDLDGDQSIRCLENGSWSSQPPRCKESCGRTAYQTSIGHCSSNSMTNLVSKRGSLPWIAHLSIQRNKQSTGCGASLIADRWLMTAAHCVDGLSPNNIKVTIGHISRIASDNFIQTPRVSKIVMHSDFERSSFDRDIALLQLERSVSYNKYVQPVCLMYNRSHPIELMKSAFRLTAGWGADSSAGITDVMHERCVSLGSKSKCQNYYSNKKLTKSMQCSKVSGNGNCKADGGSGLFYFDDKTKQWYITGLVSWGEIGKRCSTVGSYDVYTKINHRLSEWIRNQLR